MEYLYNGIFYSNKKLTIDTHNSIYEYHQHAVEILKPNTEESMLYNSIYVNFKDKEN